MKRRLWHFHGGLHLDGHKAMSMREPITEAPLPERLVLPLAQHIGAPAEPEVQVGERVRKGQRIARATEYVSAPIHASTSGTVVAIEERAVPHPSGLSAPCIVIEADGEDAWIERQPVPDYESLDPSALRNVIREAGIVGLGGAGFPSFIKLNPGPDKVVDLLILNGAECEPYITCDAMLMQEHPRRIIDGLLIMRHALQAKRCIIAIEDNKTVAHTVLVNALQEHEAEFIEVVQVPTIYPTGGEKQLIKVLTGREVPSNGLPIDIGMVCHNVATAAAVHDAIAEGTPLIERIVTVTGEALDRPCNLRVRIGTPFSTLLKAGQWRETETDEILMGGPMMGFVIPDLDVPVVKTTNCVLARPRSQPHRQPAMPCIRCGQCARVCPAQLLPQQLYWYAHARNFDRIQDYHLFDCIECGCCAYVCPSHIPLVQYYRFAKTEIWAQERQKQKADRARQRHEWHLERLARRKREEEERRRRKKELLKKSKAGGDAAKKAEIEAALARVKAKKASQQAARENTENLTEAQKQAIAAVEARRQRLRKGDDSGGDAQ